MKKLLLLLSVFFLFGCEKIQEAPAASPAPSAAADTQKPSDSLSSYGRSLLNQKQQSVYDDILGGYLRMEDMLPLNAVTISELEEIIQAVLRDHPEIYYLDSSFRYETKAGGGMIYYPSYRFSKAEIEKYNAAIEKKCRTILSAAENAQSEYEKVLSVYDALLDMLSYDEGAKENQNILSTFVYGRTVCAGYAKGMQYLLNKLDIPCTILTGISLQSKEAHAWNMIFLEGSYYYMDPTNGDLDYASKELRYMFAIMSREQIDRINKAAHEEEKKESTSAEALYFQRNNAYFTSFDKEKMIRLIKKEEAEEEFSLIYQCDSLSVGEQIKKELTESALLYEYSTHKRFTIYEFKETCTYAIVPEGRSL